MNIIGGRSSFYSLWLVYHRGSKINPKAYNIPAARDFDKSGLLASDQGLHPGFGFLRVVDFRPGVACPQPVHVGVVVRHRVVVLDAVA
jgi:hypothetical protein